MFLRRLSISIEASIWLQPEPMSGVCQYLLIIFEQ
jgi:hypothetical protein